MSSNPVARPSKRKERPNPTSESQAPPRKVVKRKRDPGVNPRYPPLRDLDSIYTDLTSNALQIGLAEALRNLNGQPLRVATMCSGTEAPILSIHMINEALEKMDIDYPKLVIEHVFSSEIVPFKQAYIERNFAPPIIFRDMRELGDSGANGGKCTTAYGASVSVPADVDLLVAGFSCVDFSNLNKNRKELSDLGESGDTFRAVVRYAVDYRPPIIILENVTSAPWKYIKAVMENDQSFMAKNLSDFDTIWESPDDEAYTCITATVDTKLYYIPHTRQRTYMFCISKRVFAAMSEQQFICDSTVAAWQQMMTALQRPASVSVEEFILDNDDPRVQRAKQELSKTDPDIKRVYDWALCALRHVAYRKLLRLGDSRPITGWVNGGTATSVDYWWRDWTAAQVERIWDTFEVSYLRSIIRGYDPFFKSRVWELSQNVDRFTDTTHFGICNCITPTGQPFLTTRGGPIVGLESLLLQGLPIEKLNLTRETNREIQDLAGNAMSSTVVGSAILSALIVGYPALMRFSRGRKVKKLAVAPAAALVLEDMDTSQIRPDQRPVVSGIDETNFVEDLCKLAARTTRLCICEGQTLITSEEILICKSCHHHICRKCTTKPHHNFEYMSQLSRDSSTRIEPRLFYRALRDNIPMVLTFSMSIKHLERLSCIHYNILKETDWEHFKRYTNGYESVFDNDQFRFQSVKRSHCWTITYESALARLELIFDDGRATWLFFGKPDPRLAVRHPAQRLLKYPIGRMDVAKNDNLLNGTWQFRRGGAHPCKVEIKGVGDLVAPWVSTLGLKRRIFSEKKIWPFLRINALINNNEHVAHDISGVYEWLPDCGTAFSYLYVRVASLKGKATPRLYFFLDPERVGEPTGDCFVFSPHINRLDLHETRFIVAKLDSRWRPSSERISTVVCATGDWLPCGDAYLRRSFGFDTINLSGPQGRLEIPPFDTTNCAKQTIAVVSCTAPRGQFGCGIIPFKEWIRVRKDEDPQLLGSIAWMFFQLLDYNVVPEGWHQLETIGRFDGCVTCAPLPPKILWMLSPYSRNQKKIIAYENTKQAIDFERQIKNCPTPFELRVRIDDTQVQLQVGLNLPAMAHRLLSKFPGNAESSTRLIWRIDSMRDRPLLLLPEFRLLDNKDVLPTTYNFPTNHSLRAEQKRSVGWMQRQEAVNAEEFIEEEISEALVEQMSWRAVMRAQRPRRINGGVLADVVGYGKTATTLALIDVEKNAADLSAQTTRLGYISTKATLVLVPPHLLNQWYGQVQKFLGTTQNIMMIKNTAVLQKKTVKDFVNARIIIMSKDVFKSPGYIAKLAYFAAVPQPSSINGRAFEAWVEQVIPRLEQHTEELKGSSNIFEFKRTLDQRLKDAENDEGLLHDLPTARLRGAQYTSYVSKHTADYGRGGKRTQKDAEAAAIALDKASMSASDREFEAELQREAAAKKAKEDKSHFMNVKTLGEMRNPCPHQFHYHRIVIDEYTYLNETEYVAITCLKALNKWILSGTPDLGDFGSVHRMARLIGVFLGVVDDAAGVLRQKTIQSLRLNRTVMERFRAYAQSFTPEWHLEKQAIAQGFLDHFVRQDKTEHQDIPCQRVIRGVELSRAEMLLYVEFQLLVQAHNMKLVITHMSSKAEDDVRQRQQAAVKGSKTGEEALVKKAAHPHPMLTTVDDGIPGADLTATDSYVKTLEEQLLEILRHLRARIFIAESIIKVIRPATNVDEDEDTDEEEEEEEEEEGEYISDYDHWKIKAVHRFTLGDAEATRTLRRFIEIFEARTNDLVMDPQVVEKYYRDLPPLEELSDEEEPDLEDEEDDAQNNHKLDLRKAKNQERREKLAALRASVKRRAQGHVAPSSEQGRDTKIGVEAEVEESDVESDHNEEASQPDSQRFDFQDDEIEEMQDYLDDIAMPLHFECREYVRRLRTLRFAKVTLLFEKWDSGEGGPPVCGLCDKFVSSRHGVSVNASCGHVTCDSCFRVSEICIHKHCRVRADFFRHRKPSQLGSKKHTTAGKFGSKTEALIKLIKFVIPEEDQVLVFIQYDELMELIAKALDEAGIKNHAISKAAGPAAVEMIDDFQENDTYDKAKALLLNPLNETAAGANLTTANHVIFLSPLLVDNQYDYNAARTQAIGRARRYGQKKEVIVWDFLAVSTYDVDAYQIREEGRLVKRGKGGTGGEWSMVTWAGIPRKDQVEGWECGFTPENFTGNK